MMKKHTKIMEALHASFRAQREYEKVVENECPPGKVVRYEHGDSVITVVVVRPARDRLLVENLNTGKEYFLSACRVLEPDHD